jgi:hypothetical protein
MDYLISIKYSDIDVLVIFITFYVKMILIIQRDLHEMEMLVNYIVYY